MYSQVVNGRTKKCALRFTLLLRNRLRYIDGYHSHSSLEKGYGSVGGCLVWIQIYVFLSHTFWSMISLIPFVLIVVVDLNVLGVLSSPRGAVEVVRSAPHFPCGSFLSSHLFRRLWTKKRRDGMTTWLGHLKYLLDLG